MAAHNPIRALPQAWAIIILGMASLPYIDPSAATGGNTGAPIGSHSDLSGLGNDDHPQYHTDARGDARYSQLGHVHNVAASNSNGFLSAADKAKLDGIAAGAEVNVNADWNAASGDAQILNKPTSFTPSAHKSSHATGGADALAPSDIGAQPAGSYAAATHAHAISDVTNLQTALDGKQPSGSYAPATGISPSAITGTAVVTNDARLSDARTPLSHNHDDRYYTETEIDAGLSGKAASIHSHNIADVTNLQTALDGKQASGSYELTSNRNAANGYAGLGADGKIALTQLPDANALESEAIAFAIALG